MPHEKQRRSKKKKGKLNMKHLRKILTLFLMVTVLAMVPMLQSSAASTVPANVTKLTAKAASETSIKLTWKKAKGAAGYMIYLIDNETGATVKKVATTKKLTYTVKNLKIGQKYTYQVFAYKKVKNTTYVSEAGSPKASVTLKLYTPATPTGFKVSKYGNGTLTLKWNKAKNATGYYLYQYDTEEEKFVKIATLTGRTYTVRKLESGEKCRFILVSYRKKGSLEAVSGKSKELSVTARTYSAATKTVQARRYYTTVKSDTTATVVKSGKKITVKKGTKVYAISRTAKGTVTVYMKDGTAIKINAARLRYGNIVTTKTYYSKSVKEAFVNDRGYTSKTKWLIWINQYTLNTTIFKGSQGNWKMMRSMPCVVGRNGATTTGVHKLCRRDYAYGGPRVYFTWNAKLLRGNSFHMRVDGTTRAAASHGCVRLGTSDLHYLVNNCPMGTTVVSY